MSDLLAARARLTGVESRSLAFTGVELRAAAADPSKLTFVGYASVTDQPYEMEDWLGSYNEIVRAGAFTQTLKQDPDVAFLLNHAGVTMARTKSGTLQLAEDSTGLHVGAELDPVNPDVQVLRSGIERGDLDEMSFAFRVVRQEWSPDYEQRDILEVNLNKGDVSVVNYGANPHTGGLVSMRSILKRIDLFDEDEALELLTRLQKRFIDDVDEARAAEVVASEDAIEDSSVDLAEVARMLAEDDSLVLRRSA